MAVTTSSFPELLWPGIRKIMGLSYKDWPVQYPRLFQIEKSDRAFEKMQGVTGFGLAGKKVEHGMIPYTEPAQGYMQEFVHDVYAIGTTVTREMYEDDQYRYINKLPSLLARSMRHTEETVAWNILNRAFTSGYTGADGKVLCATDHPLIRGGTYANRPVSAADLDQASLEAAITAARQQTDDAGLKVMANTVNLVIPPGLEMTAKKLLNTNEVVGTNDNDINPVKGTLGLIMSPYLTDDDTWFITTDVPDCLIWFWRRRTEPQKENVPDTHVMKFAITARYTCGFMDPRGIYGVPGAD